MQSIHDRNVDLVWNNGADKRFQPKAYSSKGTGWGVWDMKEQRYIEGIELGSLSEEYLSQPLKPS